MSTLTDGTTTATISDDLQWVDEFDWNPVTQKTGRTITGALWVEEAALTEGRPITLQGDAETGWMSRTNLLALQTLAQTPAAALTLTLRGVTYDVMFDHESSKPIDAKPVVGYADVAGADNYVINALRLRTV